MSVENYIIGGYFLVEGTSLPEYSEKSILPKTIWSLSECICNHHPPCSTMSWVKPNEQQNEVAYQKALELDDFEYIELSKSLDNAFNDKEYGWSNMFIDPVYARDFADKYLSKIDKIKLFMIATSEKYADLFLEEDEPKGNMGANGVYLCLKEKNRPQISWKPIGYDVLGSDGCGSFHSFLCNSVETELHNKFNVSFNELGLLESFSDAEKSTEDMNSRDDVEPVLWTPWAVYELEKS